jgi:Predicted transcriptional regulator
MAKKISAPLERTARLLDLVPYISSHQGISLKELAQTFKVDQEQMTSDLTTLWMCGLPGYTPLELMDLDFESGFVTIHNAETLSKPRSISFDEGVALVLGLDLLRSAISSDRSDLLERIDLLSQRLAGLIKLPSALSATALVNQEVSSAISEALKSEWDCRLLIILSIGMNSVPEQFTQLQWLKEKAIFISAPTVIAPWTLESFE